PARASSTAIARPAPRVAPATSPTFTASVTTTLVFHTAARLSPRPTRSSGERSWSTRSRTAAEGELMLTLDHVGFAVADYQRSKAFYEKAFAPLGLKLLLEFSGAAAGFGRNDGERPSFFIEAEGEPVRGRLHIALRADTRAQVDAFHAAAIEAGGTD